MPRASRSALAVTAFAAVATALPVAGAEAPLSARMRACIGEARVPQAQRLKECTAIIEAKRETRDHRVIAYINRAIVHYEVLRQARQALADLDAAIRLDPNASPAYRFRARLLRDEGKVDLAIADYDTLIRLNPGEAELFVQRALLWKSKGDRERAIADLGEAIRLKPRIQDAYAYRGRLLVDLGDFDRAIAGYTEAIAAADPDAFPSPAKQFTLDRGYVHFMRADFAAAAADLFAAIDETPFSLANQMAVPFHYLARARLGKDDPTLLREQAERWRRTPLIFELFLGGKTPEQVLATAGPETLTPKCHAHFYVGEWHLMRGNRTEARERFAAASSGDCAGMDITAPAARAELKRLGS